MKILFVCTGNSCRSPMAEGLAKKIFAEKGIDCEVFSRGIAVFMAQPPSENAIEAMKDYDIDISDYKTRQVTGNDVEDADLIFAVTLRHKNFLTLKSPMDAEKILILNEYAGLGQSDITDPFGSDLATYKNCAKELETAIYALAEKIQPEKFFYTGLGCDHGGYELMQKIRAYFTDSGILFKDYGTFNEESTDYPIYANKVAKAVLSGRCRNGILVCGTGIGISIAANRHKGIRAALCHDIFSARATRDHNNANILCMGGRIVGPDLALEIVKTFLATEFSNGERHVSRINQLDS